MIFSFFFLLPFSFLFRGEARLFPQFCFLGPVCYISSHLPSSVVSSPLSISLTADTCWQVLRATTTAATWERLTGPEAAWENPLVVSSAPVAIVGRALRGPPLTGSLSCTVTQGQQLRDGLLLRPPAPSPSTSPGPWLWQQQRDEHLTPGLWQPGPGFERLWWRKRCRRKCWKGLSQTPRVSSHTGETRPGYWRDRKVLVPLRVPFRRDIPGDWHGGHRGDFHFWHAAPDQGGVCGAAVRRRRDAARGSCLLAGAQTEEEEKEGRGILRRWSGDIVMECGLTRSDPCKSGQSASSWTSRKTTKWHEWDLGTIHAFSSMHHDSDEESWKISEKCCQGNFLTLLTGGHVCIQ